MKIWEIRLQNGIFVYKAGISFTKWDFHLQRETLGLQTGLSLYISPTFIMITTDLSRHDKKLLQNWKLCSTISLPVSKKYEKIITGLKGQKISSVHACNSMYYRE